MGIYFFDEYSLLHLLFGMMFYILNISFASSVLAHTLFEIIENTYEGGRIINKNARWWPGGKPTPDSTMNSIGDTVFFVIGWMLAWKMMNDCQKLQML